MSEPKPTLVAVPGPGAAEVEAQPTRPTRPTQAAAPSWKLLFWITLGLLLACVTLLASQTRQLEALGGEVVSLRGELAASERALEGHRRHLGAIRSSVSSLSELVGRDPSIQGAAGDAQPLP